MPRGRPVRSSIRQNIVEILSAKGIAYGYEIHKIYKELYPECTREVIYYHLKKGVAIGEFAVAEVKLEKGNYSWGGTVEKKYYRLGPHGRSHGDQRVKDFLKK